MRFLGLSVTALGLVVAACSSQYPPPAAIVQQQHAHATCAYDPCIPPRSATQSPAVWTAPQVTMSTPDSTPVLDVEQVCRGIAAQGGVTFHDPEIAKAKKDCLDSEQVVRDELVKKWGGFDGSDRAHCVTETKMGGELSYTELVTCLEMAADVRKLHEEADGARPVLTIGQR